MNGSEVCIVSPLMGYSSCRDLLNAHFPEGDLLFETKSVIILVY